jgi:hypothetical protein
LGDLAFVAATCGCLSIEGPLKEAGQYIGQAFFQQIRDVFVKAFVHLGMHKTGTSSVQESYARHAPKGFFYPTGRGTNLNVDARLLFEEDKICAQIPYILRHGQEILPKLRHTAEESLLRQLGDSPCDKVILSAERFTYMSHPAVERFHDFLGRHFDETFFFAYIRDPISFVKSSFQQRLKSGGCRINFQADYPGYQARFKKYEDIFGRDRVGYRLFRRDTLQGGDVVRDLAGWLGSSYRTEDVQTTNEGLSIEAIALLYTYARHGPQTVDDPTRKAAGDKALIEALSEFGSGKWHLDPAVLDGILADIAEDCAWMNARLDAPLVLAETETLNPVSNGASLEAIALRAFPDLRDHLAARLSGTEAKRLPELAAKVDFLRAIS